MHPFERAAHDYVLGRWFNSDLVALAIREAGEGVDVPSVYVLAGLQGHDIHEAWAWFERVLDELEIRVPTYEEAALRAIREAAGRLVAGEIDEEACCVEIESFVDWTEAWSTDIDGVFARGAAMLRDHDPSGDLRREVRNAARKIADLPAEQRPRWWAGWRRRRP